VQDDLSGPNPAVPTRNIDISGLTAEQRAAGAKAFGDVSDEDASADWTGALKGAAAQGATADEGSGPVLAQSDGWDDVVLDAALNKAAEESSVDLSVGELPPDEPVAEERSAQPVVKGTLEILDEPPAEQVEPIALTKPKLSPDDVLRMPAAPSLTGTLDEGGLIAGAPGLELSTAEADGAPAMHLADAEVALHTGDVEVASAEDLALISGEGEASGLELDTERSSLEGARVLGDAGGEAAPAKAVEPALTIDDAAEMLDSSYKARVREAQDYLRAQGKAAIPALAGRFPGRLLVDPFASESVLTANAADLGPLMELLQSMGPLGLEAAIPHLDAPQPGHRFCATFLFKLTPDERCLDLLKKRLHDHEPNIRLAAAAAMDEFIAHPRFAHVLQHLRDRLTSPSPEAQERAVVLLGQFSDVGSVPSLIDLLDDSHAGVRAAAHVALCDICLVNNGKKSKAWTKWWEKARKRSRVDWVIDALRSRDESVRRVARVELTNLTGGDDFGFEPAAAKRDRDKAVRAVEQWWDEQRAALSA
jgi:HEAT repeat protein